MKKDNCWSEQSPGKNRLLCLFFGGPPGIVSRNRHILTGNYYYYEPTADLYGYTTTIRRCWLKCIIEVKSVVIHDHATKLRLPQSLSGYIRSVILVEPSLRPSRAALELPYNASLATVGGKEFDGSATDDITVYNSRVTVQQSARIRAIDGRSGNVTDALKAQSHCPWSTCGCPRIKDWLQCYGRSGRSSPKVLNGSKLPWRCYVWGFRVTSWTLP